MASDNISPEERLFKIIKDGNDAPPKNGDAPVKIAKQPGGGGIKKFLFNFRNPKSPAVSSQPQPAFETIVANLQKIDPASVNKVVAAALFLFSIFVVYYAMDKRYNIAKITEAASRIPPRPHISRTVEDLKPLQFYTAEARKRDIFRLVKLNTEPVKPTLKQLTKDFSLAGIYQGDRPEAMIEDKAVHKTYFLKVGDDIRGIEVKSILKDKIILKYGGEEIELY